MNEGTTVLLCIAAIIVLVIFIDHILRNSNKKNNLIDNIKKFEENERAHKSSN